MLIIGILVSIIIFSIIVILHELGHFSAARFFGVRVEEFGLGIPPIAKLIFTDKKGTNYTLNWLPLGGFVKLTGEQAHRFFIYDKENKIYNNVDLESDIKKGVEIYDKQGNILSKIQKDKVLELIEENKADYNLANKPAIQQAIIILAGVVMNFILAAIIFSVLFFIGIKPIGVNTKIQTELPVKIIPNYQQALESGLLTKNPGIILHPIQESFAEKIGIKKGDIIVQANSCENSNNTLGSCTIKNSYTLNSFQDLGAFLEENKSLKVEFISNSQSYIGILPENGKIGSYISENIQINQDFEYKYSFIDSVKYGFSETYYQSLLTFKGIGILVQKIFNPETPQERQEAIQQVSGPIGIVDFITNSMSSGIKFLFIIAAVISINLGVFNLLPIPALDGGRFVFITINGLIEKLFGKKAINANLENLIHVGFFILLIALSILIAYNDIIKIINN